MNKQSLKVRYLYKLITNLVGIPIGLITESIIPRALGSKLYGDFSFISGFFQNLMSFFDMGSSNAFYDKISKRPNETLIRIFYWKLVGIISIIVSISVLLLLFSDLSETIWPNQTPKFIIMGLLLGLLYWYSQIVLKVIDAYALSKQGELVRISQRFLRIFIVIPMYLLDFFSLENFFVYNYVILLYSIVAWILILNKNNINIYPRISISNENLKLYLKEFYLYCLPLVIYSSIAMIAGIFDRWILQTYGGSIQQGYYGIAYQISSICFIFTSAMTPLIFREFSIEIDKNNLKKIREIFKRYIPMLYSVAAYFSIFIAINSKTVVYIIGGVEFTEAYLTVMLMALYPMHQTYGQLSSTLYYSTNRTKLYKNIGVIVLLFGIPISFLLMSSETMGLNLGSSGLAIKMLLIQFIQTNVLLWYNTKFLNENFFYFFRHQIFSVLFFLVLGLISDYLTDLLPLNNLILFLIDGLLYSFLICISSFFLPQVFATSRNEIIKYKNQAINFFK